MPSGELFGGEEVTLKECQAAAKRGVKIRHIILGVTFDRIEFVGYKYKDGQENPCVRLLDKCGNSVTDANPLDLQLEEYARASEMMEGKKC
jgi:hypothetical protein